MPEILDERGLLLCTKRLSCALPEDKVDCRKMADGLFLSTARDVAQDYPDITFDAELLDNTCLRVAPCVEISSRLSLILHHTMTGSWLCLTYTEISFPIYLLGTD